MMGIGAKISRYARQIGHPRNLVAFFLGTIMLAVWGLYGMQIITTLNPQLGHELEISAHPALNVWVTLPRADAVPLIISTPAGVRFEEDTLILPQGSVISAHLGEQDGAAPQLVIDGDAQEFTIDSHGDYVATATLSEAKKVFIRRGWMILATWKIRIVPDTSPRVEDDATKSARARLRDARQDLTDALNHGAEKAEIDILTERLHGVMNVYLSRIAHRPKSAISAIPMAQ